MLVSGSGGRWYGDRGDEELGEGSAPGHGFLGDVVKEWESATRRRARQDPRRPAALGLWSSAKGGLLEKLLPFRLGAAGSSGGRQWLSWIALDDVIGATLHLIRRDVRGPVNAPDRTR